MIRLSHVRLPPGLSVLASRGPGDDLTVYVSDQLAPERQRAAVREALRAFRRAGWRSGALLPLPLLALAALRRSRPAASAAAAAPHRGALVRPAVRRVTAARLRSGQPKAPTASSLRTLASHVRAHPMAWASASVSVLAIVATVAVAGYLPRGHQPPAGGSAGPGFVVPSLGGSSPHSASARRKPSVVPVTAHPSASAAPNSPTASRSPTGSHSPAPSTSPRPSPTPTATPSPTPSPSPTRSPTPTPSASPSPQPTGGGICVHLIIVGLCV